MEIKTGRKRTRCKACKKRIWMRIDIDNKHRKFSCFCPKCGSHDKVRLITKK